jgi:hypothetical protein
MIQSSAFAGEKNGADKKLCITMNDSGVVDNQSGYQHYDAARQALPLSV